MRASVTVVTLLLVVPLGGCEADCLCDALEADAQTVADTERDTAVEVSPEVEVSGAEASSDAGPTEPPLPVVGLVAAPPNVTGTLHCQVSFSATAGATPEVRWEVAGYESVAPVDVAVVALPREPAGTAARRGDVIRCRARVRLDDRESPWVTSAAVTIENAPPTATPPTIGPEGATRGTPLTCTGAVGSDPDGDSVALLAAFRVDGVIVVPPEGVARGDAVRCEVVPDDGFVAGPPVTSAASLVIGNATPSIGTVLVTPHSTARSGTFTCAVTGLADLDPQDTPTATFAWLRLLTDGSTAALGSGATLSAGALLPKDRVVCVATPNDGIAAGTPVVSADATVVNLPPTLAGVTLGPEGATVSDTLTCAPGSVQDDDGDPITLTTRWTKNGLLLSSATTSTLSGVFTSGDALRCAMTPADAFDTGVLVESAPLQIVNAPPKVSEVSLAPASGTACTVFACTGLAADVDLADVPTLTASWAFVANDGGTVTASGPSFSGAVGAGQLTCTLTATDVSGATGQASAQITLPGTLPEVLSATVVETSDGFGCEVTLPPEVTGCPVEVERTFLVDGTVAAVQLLLPTALAPPGVVVTCSARLRSGALLGTPTASAPFVVFDPTAFRATLSLDGALPTCLVEGLPPLATVTSTVYRSSGTVLPGPWAVAPTACERLECQHSAQVNGVSITSALAVTQLPMGPACVDTTPCTADTCATDGGCRHVAIEGSCTDGDACTHTDSCAQGACHGTPVECADLNPCTTEDCDPSLGCLTLLAKGPCDADGSQCTENDACDGGLCVKGTPRVCNDQNACTQDACDALAGCVSTPVAGACDDHDACTANDQCASGQCHGAVVQDGTSCPNGRCLSGSCVENVPPSAPTLVTVTPALPQSGATLSCQATGALDPDGWPGALTLELVWRRDGVVVGIGAVLDGAQVHKGTSLSCEARASDGLAWSAVSSATVAVKNGAPVLTTPSLSVSAGTATCSFQASDPDPNDVPTVAVRFLRNGVEVQSGPLTKLLGVQACDRIECLVEASDGAAKALASAAPLQLPLGPACAAPSCAVAVCDPSGGCAIQPVPAACDDGSPCTIDGCDPGGACTHLHVTGPCDADGSMCTAGDVCASGKCVAGPWLSCVESVVCASDTCASGSGCLPAKTERLDFPLEIGTNYGSGVVTLPDGGKLEIVQGPQGGLHLNLAVRAVLPPDVASTPTFVSLTAETHVPCCAGPVVGGFAAPGLPLWPVKDGSGVATGQHASSIFPGVFNQSLASAYAGKACCVDVTLKIADPAAPGGAPKYESRMRQVFTCVDLQ